MFRHILDVITDYKRKIFPKTLIGRSLFIFFIILTLLEISSFYLFYRPYNDEILKLKTMYIAHSINYVVDQLEKNIDEKDSILSDAQNRFKVTFVFNPKGSFAYNTESNHQIDENGYLAKRVYNLLSMYLNNPFILYNDTDSNLFLLHIRIKNDNMNTQVVSGDQTYEPVLVVSIPYSVIFPESRYITVVIWIVSLTFFFFIMGAIFINNQIKPFRRIIRVLDRFSKGHDVSHQLKEIGGSTIEMRQASEAVKRMIFRIQRQMRQRTDMLSVVSHDLRTPITRMKLELALIDNKKEAKSIEAMQNDLIEMEKMIDGYLTFARGEGHEKSTLVHLNDVIYDAIEQWENRLKIDFESKELVAFHIKVGAFKRCLSNIFSNASRYATHVRVDLYKHRKKVFINIEDNGPGIEEKHMEYIFRPFYRPANDTNKGSGLGLAIIKDIMRSHGGDVFLSKSTDMGGLKVTLMFEI